jgi:hypothetical protein
VQRIAGIKQRVGQIQGDFQCPARPDAGTGDAVDLRDIAAGGAISAGQVLVIFGLGAGHPQAADISAQRIGDIERQIGAVAP